MDDETNGVSLALLVATACGSGGDDLGGGGGSVTAISGPLEAYAATVFVVHGTGFGAAGSTAQVRFTTTGGETPFEGLTSDTTMLDVEVLSSTTAMGVTEFAGAHAFSASVELLPAGGGTLAGPGVVAFFQETYAVLLGPNDETLVGTPGPDVLDGGIGFDSLYGGAGDDQLFGGPDRDNLHGEGGNDTLDGGSQPDNFFVVPAADADTIVDFQVGVDRLVLSGVPDDLTAFALIASVSDAGGDVVVGWSGAGTLTFEGLGTGAIDDLASLVDRGVEVILRP